MASISAESSVNLPGEKLGTTRVFCLSIAIRVIDSSSRSCEIRPEEIALLIASNAEYIESTPAQIAAISFPARIAITAASPTPYSLTIAPISRSSVITKPLKSSWPRRRVVTMVPLNEDGKSLPFTPVSCKFVFGKAAWAIITESIKPDGKRS